MKRKSDSAILKLEKEIQELKKVDNTEKHNAKLAI
jgi:hypothetical protein